MKSFSPMKTLIKPVFLFMFSVVLWSSSSVNAQQEDLTYFLDQSVSYDASIPTPKQVLGFELGEWHVRHDQLVEYMYAVAEASDRVHISEYARTYENRKLLSLIITSPENHKNIDEIKQAHRNLSDPSVSSTMNLEEMPVVVLL